MRCFTVHRRDTGLFTEPDTVLVKEGVSWPAFFFTFIWALWQRMWLTAILILIVQIGAGILADWLRLSWLAELALNIGVLILIGYGANDWRRRSLARRGYEEVGVVCGRDRDEAEFRLVQVERNEGLT